MAIDIKSAKRQVESYNAKRILLGQTPIEFKINRNDVILYRARDAEGSISIPQFVTIIGDGSFLDSKITRVNIPSSIKSC